MIVRRQLPDYLVHWLHLPVYQKRLPKLLVQVLPLSFTLDAILFPVVQEVLRVLLEIKLVALLLVFFPLDSFTFQHAIQCFQIRKIHF